MRRLFLRIALNGGLAAAVLGLIGLLYAELAGLAFAAGRAPERFGPVEVGVPPPPPPDDITPTLRTRVPLAMAGGGFLFVAACEGLLYWWRGHPAEKKTKAPRPTAVDPERQIAELLARVEADKGQGTGVGSQGSGVSDQRAQSPP